MQPSQPRCSPRSMGILQKEIANLDAEFDKLQDIWSNGEANGFFTETLLVPMTE